MERKTGPTPGTKNTSSQLLIPWSAVPCWDLPVPSPYALGCAMTNERAKEATEMKRQVEMLI